MQSASFSQWNVADDPDLASGMTIKTHQSGLRIGGQRHLTPSMKPWEMQALHR